MSTRVHLDLPLRSGERLELPESAFRHLVQVLRMRAGESLTVFNGQGGEYQARLATVAKRAATMDVGAFVPVERESTLRITLVQGLSKGDRMDWTLQKATELGIYAVQPVVTERCNVSLDGERAAKKLEHWRGVMVSACEQSGRTRVPRLHEPLRWTDWLAQSGETAAPRLVLDPGASRGLFDAGLGIDAEVAIAVGPEGGFSPQELELAVGAAVIGVRLGPRVLRTETAGPVAVAILQALKGDMAHG